MVKLLQIGTFDPKALKVSGLEFRGNKAFWNSPHPATDLIALPEKHEFVIQLNDYYIEVFRRDRG